MLKNPPANTGRCKRLGSDPLVGRSSGGGHENLLQNSCLENPFHRGGWQATVHGVTKELDMTEATEHTHLKNLVDFYGALKSPEAW